MTVDKTVTWLLELFEKKVLKFQMIVETRPNTIETNVTDEVVKGLKSRTERDSKSILELQATDRLAQRAN